MPGAFTVGGIFLLIWSDHDSWPIGSLTLSQSFSGSDPEILQHKAYGILAFGVGVIEFFRRLGWFAHAAWTVPLPLNRHLLTEPVGSEPYLLLISPVVGSAVPVQRGEAVVILAVAEAGREGAAEWSWNYVAARQTWLSHKGVAATKREAHRVAFAQTLGALAPRLAKFVEFGLIAPR